MIYALVFQIAFAGPVPAPPPAPATGQYRTPGKLMQVDLIIVNQYSRAIVVDGVRKNYKNWYTSFWDIYHFPPWGMFRMPVMCHRGWAKTIPLIQCTGGWAHPKPVIFAPVVLQLDSNYDFEYSNRAWMNSLTSPPNSLAPR